MRFLHVFLIIFAQNLAYIKKKLYLCSEFLKTSEVPTAKTLHYDDSNNVISILYDRADVREQEVCALENRTLVRFCFFFLIILTVFWSFGPKGQDCWHHKKSRSSRAWVRVTSSLSRIYAHPIYTMYISRDFKTWT